MPSGTDLLGDAIRAARMKKGYTQEVFAEMLDITPVHLANIEGSRRKPSVPLLFRMMELFESFCGRPGFSGEDRGNHSAYRRSLASGGGRAGPID